MFTPEANRLKLPLAVGQVLRVYRSINPVQVALPGFPGQKAGAFICVFAARGGIRVAIALDMQDSHRLYFYFNDEGVVPRTHADKVIDEALFFTESMGYVMADLELNKSPLKQREVQWRALPLAQGLKAPTNASGKSPDPGQGKREAREEQTTKVQSDTAPQDEVNETKRQRLIANIGRILAAY